MEPSIRNASYLEFLQDIYEISHACGTKTYIWGGLTIDIFEGKFLREHDDIDGFISNMYTKLDLLRTTYEKKGYHTDYVNDIGMLKVMKNGLHAAFNCLVCKHELAVWHHIGQEGMVFFPVDWLDQTPRHFYSTLVYTSGLKFEYAIKKTVCMLNPEWLLREKDRICLHYLENAAQKQGINKEEFLKQIWSFNPYWIKLGYKQYMLPIMGNKLHSQ